MSKMAEFFKKRDANKTDADRAREAAAHEAAITAAFHPEVVTAPEVTAPEMTQPAETTNTTSEVVTAPEVTPAPEKVKDAAPRWCREMNGNTYHGVLVLNYNYAVSAEKGHNHSDAICPACGKTFTARSWNIKAGHKTHCGCQRKKKPVEIPLSEVKEKLNETHVDIPLAEVETIL